MGTFGYALLILALVCSLVPILASIFVPRQKRSGLISAGIIAAFVLVTLSEIVLGIALMTHNFAIDYVAQNSSRDLPGFYLFTALWAGNAGSLLLWGWILSLCAAIIVLQRRNKDRDLVNFASVVLSVVQLFFLILLVFISNPFTSTSPAPADGTGLNPALQNPGMIIHPPLLLAGYVILAVPFAFAIAAMWLRKLDEQWLLKSRNWLIIGWLLLGIGNLVGAWWAYVDLAFGGYWAWDPVENAGLMPWLLATALVHSALFQRRRGKFKSWTISLSILGFLLTIIGTFISRSNILKSAAGHSFGLTGYDPFFIIALALIFVSGFGLMYSRRDLLHGGEIENLWSRDGSFLLNNVLLVASTVVIFVGTILPGFFNGVIQKAFFNVINIPIFVVIILLAAICVLIGWRQFTRRDFITRMFWPLIIAVAAVLALAAAGFTVWWTLTAVLAAFFLIASTGWQLISELNGARTAASENAEAPPSNRFWMSKNRWGAYVVHLGIALIAIGVIGSSAYDFKTTHSFKPGDSYTIKGYTLNYSDLSFSGTNSKMVVTAKFNLSKNGKPFGPMNLVKDYYSTSDPNNPNIVTHIGLRSTPAQDFYVILSDWDQQKTVSLQILINPLVMWIWIGGWVLLAGGMICFWPQPQKNLPAPRQVETAQETTQVQMTPSVSPSATEKAKRRKSRRR